MQCQRVGFILYDVLQRGEELLMLAWHVAGHTIYNKCRVMDCSKTWWIIDYALCLCASLFGSAMGKLQRRHGRSPCSPWSAVLPFLHCFIFKENSLRRLSGKIWMAKLKLLLCLLGGGYVCELACTHAWAKHLFFWDWVFICMHVYVLV